MMQTNQLFQGPKQPIQTLSNTPGLTGHTFNARPAAFTIAKGRGGFTAKGRIRQFGSNFSNLRVLSTSAVAVHNTNSNNTVITVQTDAAHGKVDKNIPIKKVVSNDDRELDDISDSPLANDDHDVSIVEETWENISEGSFGDADERNSAESVKNPEFSVGYRQSKCFYLKYLKRKSFFKPKIYVYSMHRCIVSCVNMQEKVEEDLSEPEVFYVDDETSSESVVEIERVDGDEITVVSKKNEPKVSDATIEKTEPELKLAAMETGNKGKDGNNQPVKVLDFFQGQVAIQSRLDSSSAALIGMEFIIEVRKAMNSTVLKYSCFLCKEDLVEKSVLDHLTDTKHRVAYLVKYFPSGSKRFSGAKPFDETLAGELEATCVKITTGQQKLWPFVTTQSYLKEHREELNKAIQNTNHFVEEIHETAVHDQSKIRDDSEVIKSSEGNSNSSIPSVIECGTDEEVQEVSQSSAEVGNNGNNFEAIQTISNKLMRQRRKNRNRRLRRQAKEDGTQKSACSKEAEPQNIVSIIPGMGFLSNAAVNRSVLRDVALQESKHNESNKKLSNEIAIDKAKGKQTLDRAFMSVNVNKTCSVKRKIDAAEITRKTPTKNKKGNVLVEVPRVSQKESKLSTPRESEKLSSKPKELSLLSSKKPAESTEKKQAEKVNKCPHKKKDEVKNKKGPSPSQSSKHLVHGRSKRNSPVHRSRSSSKSASHLPRPPANLIRHSQSSRQKTSMTSKSPNRSLQSRSPERAHRKKSPLPSYSHKNVYRKDNGSLPDSRRQGGQHHTRRSRSISRPRFRADSPQRKRSDSLSRYRGDSPHRQRSDSLSRFRGRRSRDDSISPRSFRRRSRSSSRSDSVRRSRRRYRRSRSPISRSRSRSQLRGYGRRSYSRGRSISPHSFSSGRQSDKRRQVSRSRSREPKQSDISEGQFMRGLKELEEFSRSVSGDVNPQQHGFIPENQAPRLPFHSGGIGLPHHYNPQIPPQQPLQIPFNIPPPNMAQSVPPPFIRENPPLPHVTPDPYMAQPPYSYPPPMLPAPTVIPPPVAQVPYAVPQPHLPVVNPNPVVVPQQSPQSFLAQIEKSSHLSPVQKENMFRDMRDQVNKIFGSSSDKFMVQDNSSHLANFSDNDISLLLNRNTVNPSPRHASQQLASEADALLDKTLAKIKTTLSMSSTTSDNEIKAAILELLPKEFFHASAAGTSKGSHATGEPFGIKSPVIHPDAKVQFKENSRGSHSGSIFPILSRGSNSPNFSPKRDVSSSKVAQSGQKLLAQRLASVLVKLGMVDVSGSLLSEMLRIIGAFDLSVPLEDISERQIVYILKECGYLKDL